MSNPTYTIHLTASRVCQGDRILHRIVCGEPITGTLDELNEAMPAAIAEQMDADGWHDGVCPECVSCSAATLHGQHHADQAREMEVAL